LIATTQVQPRESSMTLEFAYALDTGRARKNNEDSVALDAQAQVAVLADGMGGYNAGEVAAGMATSIVCTSLTKWLNQDFAPTQADVSAAMASAVDQANRAIFDAANSNPQFSGMGTTLVMAVMLEGRVIVGHVGDSRAYRLRRNQLQRLTRDHSLLQEQLDAGLITPAQAARSVNRNLVTRAIGVDAEVVLEVREHELGDQDLLLLCSDGLTDMVDDQGIADVLCKTHPSLEATCDTLVKVANDAGGRDNISVVLVRASDAPADAAHPWWSFRR
jgi:protein phosphatase